MVTFDPNGGSVFLSSMSVTNGANYNSLPNPTWSGYTFVGWYTEKSGGSQITPFTTVNLKGNQTLYAHWAKNDDPVTYIVTFNGNGTDISAPIMQVVNGTTYNDLPTINRGGYVFEGWYTEKSGGSRITPTTIVNLKGDQILYAHWTKNSEEMCTVTFDANGGTVGQKTVQVAKGGTLNSLPTPTRSGYTFVGWYNTSGPSGASVNVGDYIVEQDVTLYAWWKEEKPQETGHWGPWSSWTTKSYTASDTRQVETKEVQTVVAHMEYRYGRYVDQTGTHNCWCAKYLEGLSYISGKAVLDYSSWSTTRYSASGSTWTCGQCSGNHIGVDHVDSAGRSIWKEYRLPGNKPYYWEETRIIGAQYETQYRYRDWIVD